MAFPRRWFRRNGRRTIPEADLAAECEAFLRGESARLLEDHGRPVPAWAWVNVLAHADTATMLALAVGLEGPWRSQRSREAAVVQHLAAALIDECVSGSTTLAEIQRTRLVPLELRLGKRPDVVLRPEQLNRMVLGRKDSAPSPGVYPAPAEGRTLGKGRLNRFTLMVFGPANVSSRRPSLDDD
ncbi:MAG TPA: hypothetical protein VFP54_09125 [Acidimicrobiales bacterium]|nr:hypothetical protein [Acidimicrobiales bacterium]